MTSPFQLPDRWFTDCPMINLSDELRKLLAQRLGEAAQETREIESDLLKAKADDYIVSRLATVTAKLEVLETIVSESKPTKDRKEDNMPNEPTNQDVLDAIKEVQDQVVWLAIFCNQLWIQLSSTGGVMAGAPLLMQSVPKFPPDYTVGGTGEQTLPNQFGYRD